MFIRILVPLDGSPRAERALPAAAKIAHAANATVVLAQAVSLPSYFGTAFAPVTETPELIEARQLSASEYLQGIAQSAALAGIHTETMVLTGSPTLAILDAIVLRRIDLVVLTSHGRSGLAQWALGSVAQHLLRHARVPVLVLHDHGTSSLDAPQTPEHIFRVLAPLDGSPLAEAELRPAAALATSVGAPAQGEIHLVMVLLPSEAEPDYMPEALATRGAQGYLNTLAQRLQGEYAGLRVTWSVAAQLDVAAALLHIAGQSGDAGRAHEQNDYDVIAMATHGYSGLKHWMTRSITERVLHSATLPLLIVPPLAARA